MEDYGELQRLQMQKLVESNRTARGQFDADSERLVAALSEGNQELLKDISNDIVSRLTRELERSTEESDSENERSDPGQGDPGFADGPGGTNPGGEPDAEVEPAPHEEPGG